MGLYLTALLKISLVQQDEARRPIIVCYDEIDHLLQKRAKLSVRGALLTYSVGLKTQMIGVVEN